MWRAPRRRHRDSAADPTFCAPSYLRVKAAGEALSIPPAVRTSPQAQSLNSALRAASTVRPCAVREPSSRLSRTFASNSALSSFHIPSWRDEPSHCRRSDHFIARLPSEFCAKAIGSQIQRLDWIHYRRVSIPSSFTECTSGSSLMAGFGSGNRLRSMIDPRADRPDWVTGGVQPSADPWRGRVGAAMPAHRPCDSSACLGHQEDATVMSRLTTIAR